MVSPAALFTVLSRLVYQRQHALRRTAQENGRRNKRKTSSHSPQKKTTATIFSVVLHLRWLIFFLFFFSRFFDRKIQSGNDGKYEKFQELERSRSAKPWKPSDEDGLFLFFSFFKKQKNIDIIIVVVVSLTARRAGNWRTQRAGRAATLKIKKEKPTQTHTHTHTHTHARNKKKPKKN